MKKNDDYREFESPSNDQINSEQNDDQIMDNETDTQATSAENINPLAELQAKYDALNDSYLRLHAEFDNFRKRTMKEKADLIKGGGERVLSEMLPFADDFDRALQSMEATHDSVSIAEGLNLIYAKFVAFLQQHGVKEIDAIGEVFDADKFEAVTTVPVQDENKKGKVIDCIQKGYMMNDKIIRYPKVIVGE